MSGQKGGRPIDLFQQHDAHQLMRPGGGAEGEPQVGAVADAAAEAVGAADHEDGGGTPGVAPALDAVGEIDAVEAFAALVEQRW